jgi:hypothetical protein
MRINKPGMAVMADRKAGFSLRTNAATEQPMAISEAAMRAKPSGIKMGVFTESSG